MPEFSAKNGVFDMNDFINRCDAAVAGFAPPAPRDESVPAPPADDVPVADGDDPITYSPLEEVLQELRLGHLVLVTDDPSRENEADLICAGQFASPQNITPADSSASPWRPNAWIPSAALCRPTTTRKNTTRHLP